jgi:hypothetical protein|tara:strand:- start:54 stop:434 length:381 start_codon:yes stop_codon:yes gene_type:complete
MTGNLLNRARKDSKKYVTNGGFQEDITLKTPNGLFELQTTGLVSKHWINYDTDGTSVNSKNAHICLDEESLTLLGYPVRNSSQEVYLKNHRVSVKDSSGFLKEYVIKEWFPSETFGLIVCILGDYE